MCQLCHTQTDPTGIYRADHSLAGGMYINAFPHGAFVTANLTADSTTGIGAWTAVDIASAIRTGHTAARELNPFAMPWPFLHDLRDSDALAIGSYLKTLPPLYRQRPAPLHYGVIETVANKLVLGPPAATPKVLTYAEGDFARETPGPSRDLPQRLLVAAQWAVLIVGLIVVLVAGPKLSWRGGLASVGFLTAAGVVWFLNATPAISFFPPEAIAGPINGAIPRPPPGNAMATRGYYLFAVASCQFCHQPNGQGGWKVSAHMLGTIWTPNISSDTATGIGAWSDAEVTRAIRSGIARGGRPLHWQAMPWDLWSNWDEEDIRALVAYLRTLPPVHNVVPPGRAPAPDDCRVYTFWVRADTAAGCR
jgi:cytochrome c553